MKRFIVLALSLVACSREDAPPAVGSAAPPALTGHVEIVKAPESGDVASYVKGELDIGARDKLPVLVYVGATWCEPCRDFHAAAEAGTLDPQLGALRLLEFDLDRDGDRLEAAGYKSPLVPLFAKPGPDGRASGQQTDGVRKGGQYVEQLVPRVRALASS
ncbi:MAG: thioredoxin [Kofleriaceae bacterium]|nr:thioredoxin [Kofleriaceae bacterium]